MGRRGGPPMATSAARSLAERWERQRGQRPVEGASDQCPPACPTVYAARAATRIDPVTHETIAMAIFVELSALEIAAAARMRRRCNPLRPAY